MLLEDQITKGYLPIPGTAEYGLNVQGLLFGEDSEVISSKRASTIQSPGGTGGLRVGGDLIKQFKQIQKYGLVRQHGQIIKGFLQLVDSRLMSIPIIVLKQK